MASINTIVKRKQYLWLGIVVVGAASAIGGALYLSDVDMPVTVRQWLNRSLCRI
ncbi:putative traB domain protein [Escherichia coli P0304777.4]|nr:putative traB domain protein [Escherichia coli P0304777.4]